MEEIGVVSWKLPPREMSWQHFHEIPPKRIWPRLQYFEMESIWNDVIWFF